MTSWLNNPRFLFGLFVAIAVHLGLIFGIGLQLQRPKPPLTQVRSLNIDFFNTQAPAPLDDQFGERPPLPTPPGQPQPVFTNSLEDWGPNTVPTAPAPLTTGDTFAVLDPGGIREKRIDLRSMSRLEQLYVEQWVQRIERLANEQLLNDLRRLSRNQQGPILDVAINAEGGVHRITVTRSSGRPQLDQAMIRLVENAAPFDAFPPALRHHYDVLTIPREWQLKFD